MRVLAVPVTSLERAKTRLAPLLSPLERAAMTLAMLEDVLDAALPQETWDVWVVSPDEAVLEIAARRGARPFHETAGSLLGAVRLVDAELPRRGDELAVLLADVPRVTAEALRDALSMPAAVVAAPAASDGGTNLLVRRPPGVIAARFGRESFGKHRWAARRARASFDQVGVPELSFDLDRPQDVVALLAAGSGGRTLVACHQLDLAARLRLLRMA
jgi:2-phospho-L-lactate guanylyltransferase